MAVSIKDVAKKAGVSPGTVSNVFSGNRAVKSALIERVRNAALELGYQTDRAASQLRTKKARIVAAIVPDLDNPFFTSLIAAIESHLRDHGFDMIVASSHGESGEEAKRIAALLAWRPAGLVIIPCNDEFANRALFDEAKIPFVVVDRLPSSFDGDAVIIDNFDAGRLACEHLLNLGHQTFVVAASTLALQNIRERCAGIADVLQKAGLAAPTLIEVGLDFETALMRLATFMASKKQPTAFIALTNFATLAILGCANQNHLSVPDDISLVGFDDYSWMNAISPPITAIRQPVKQMGEAIWTRLYRHLQDNDAPSSREQLCCDLVIRASTAKPKDLTPQ
ncbi:LacI family transcriptional regulator (plasmid) [Bartonella sp. HY329]|uniref:LacI family DNA-binding transcriptional regulator n=1 Tax=unclassified Bartonella TaxID=2645622 RepID=UPI0021C9C0E6|nr:MULTISPECIES: LacI family DNA-binding transcriptional regulator [unclassified Bartonella]UXM96648.1 LacI family transcriptional regulator [Bartonella sp. HY329]UXN10971.1 LacI family transcriptional regulator [Bartonella sp. HY328]